MLSIPLAPLMPDLEFDEPDEFALDPGPDTHFGSLLTGRREALFSRRDFVFSRRDFAFSRREYYGDLGFVEIRFFSSRFMFFSSRLMFASSRSRRGICVFHRSVLSVLGFIAVIVCSVGAASDANG